MIKIFVQRDHHELENKINTWISRNSFKIKDISYSTCTSDDTIIHSIIIIYDEDNSRPC